MKRHSAPLLLLALMLATALRAWPALSLLPTDTDCTLWLERGQPSQANIYRWLFLDKHFAGYRPVSAISYWLQWLSGADLRAMLSFRWLDLALHLLVIALVPRLARALAPDAPAWTGLAAAAIFAFHPSWQDIVPVLSRRSYGLCGVFGALALISALPAMRAGRLPWVGALLALLAVWSNELGYVVLGAGLLAALDYRKWRATLPLLGATAIALAGKLLATDTVGGYTTHTWTLKRAVNVLIEASKSLALLSNEPSTFLMLAAAAVAGWLLWTGRRGLATGWFIGYFALFALGGEWFHRLAYLAALPFAIVVAQTLPLGGLARLPQAVIVAAVCWRSPLIFGLEKAAQDTRVARDSALRHLDADLGELPAKDVVFFVSVWSAPRDHNPLWSSSGRWGQRYVANTARLLHPDLDIRSLAFLKKRGPVTIGEEDGKPVVSFPANVGVFLWPLSKEDLRKSVTPWTVPLDTLRGPEGHTWLYHVRPLRGGLVPVR